MATKKERLRKEREADIVARRAALRELGADDEVGGERALVYESTAAKLLCTTGTTIRKLCDCVAMVKNPHYRSSGSLCRLYDPRHLLLVREKIPLKRKRSTYAERFAKRYVAKYEAIYAAAEAMFDLNRYARIGSLVCRESIYDLKDRFLEWLCKRDFLAARGKHILSAKEYECWDCEGRGRGCERCGGSGIYRKIPKLVLIVLCFEIGGKTYNWQIPQDRIGWKLPGDVKILETERDDHEPGFIDDDEAAMLGFQIGEAKALIEWVICDNKLGEKKPGWADETAQLELDGPDQDLL